MELFDILTEDGKKTGQTKERAAVHQDGDLHGSVHIWIIRNNRVLLQKRALDKDSFPGCFDVASSGHVDASETFLEAATREVNEELGLPIAPKDLKYLFKQRLDVSLDYPSGHFVSNEINYVYLLSPFVSLASLTPQKSEIDMLVWKDIDTLFHHLEEGDLHYCIKFQELQNVLKQKEG